MGKLFLKTVSVVVAVSFLWTNCVWASGELSAMRSTLNADTLAAQSSARQLGVDLTRNPAIGRLILGANFINELNIHNLADVIELMPQLAEEDVICFVSSDKNGGEARYIFDADGHILRITKKGRQINDSFYTLLGVNVTEKDGTDFAYRLIDLEKDVPEAERSRIETLVNSYLGQINGNWGVKILGVQAGANGKKKDCSPHLLPKYLYDIFKDRLISDSLTDSRNADSFIAEISYIDANGVIHIAEGQKYQEAVKVMADVLQKKLQENENEKAKAGNRKPKTIKINEKDVLKILQMHEEIHKLVRENQVDISQALRELMAFFNGKVGGVNALLCDFARNYNYLPAGIPPDNNLTDDQRLTLAEELLAHTIVERINFSQPVRTINQNGQRADLDLGIEKILVNSFVVPIVDGFSLALNLENIDRNYFLSLYKKYLLPLVSALKIKDNFFPSAMLTATERQQLLGAVEYNILVRNKRNAHYAKRKVRITLNPMDGGIGTSVKRGRYLKNIGKVRGLDKKGNPVLGSKSSDLYFDVKINGETKKISVMEAKLLKAILETKKGKGAYLEVRYQLLGSKEDEGKGAGETFEELLDMPCLLDPERSYRDYIALETDLKIEDVIFQAKLPTAEINNPPRLITKVVAPGGHGQWGVMILLNALGITLPSDGATVIRAFYNGDGINNGADPVITGWMARERVPVIMISTTKTGIDKKGGQIGIQYQGPGKIGPRAQMMELAQAKQAGQEQLFYRIGLPEGENDGAGTDKQYFNTNTALLNYSVLSPFLKELVGRIGLDRFVEIIAPDLLRNEKKDKGVIQLEGALGSALLNLAAYIETTDDPEVLAVKNKHKIGKFLRIVNVDKKTRTKFFTPQKNAFDYWYQFYSGRFEYNTVTWELIDKYPESPLPVINLTDAYYEDVQNVIEAFEGTGVIELSELTIKGKVKAAGIEVKGIVHIFNGDDDVVDLNKAEGIVIDLNNPENRGTFRAEDFRVNGRVVLKNVIVAFGKPENTGMDIWDSVLEYMRADARRLDEYIAKLHSDPSKSIGGKVWIHIVKHAKLFPVKSARELFNDYFVMQRKLDEIKIIKGGYSLEYVVLETSKELSEVSSVLKQAGLDGTRCLPYTYSIQDDRSFDLKILAEGAGGFRILGSLSRDNRPGAAATRVVEKYTHRIYGRERDDQANLEVNLPALVMAKYSRKVFNRDVGVWVVTNPFPIFDKHILLIGLENTRQKMDVDLLRITLEFLQETPTMSGFFNSIGANASQNHPHVQIFPETDKNMALDTVKAREMFTKMGVKVSVMGEDKTFPVSGFVFEPVNKNSADLDNLALMVQALVEDLMMENIPYNLVFRNNKVYVFPRTSLPVGRFGQSFAGAEMIGHLLLTAKELLYTPYVQDHPEVMNIDRFNQLKGKIDKFLKDHPEIMNMDNQQDLLKIEGYIEYKANSAVIDGYVSQAVEHLSLADIRNAYARVCLDVNSDVFKVLLKDLNRIAEVMEFVVGKSVDEITKDVVNEEFYFRLILLRSALDPVRDKTLIEEISYLLERKETVMAVKQLILDVYNLEEEIKTLGYKVEVEQDKEKKGKIEEELEKKRGQLKGWEKLLKETKDRYKFNESIGEMASDKLKEIVGNIPDVKASSLSKAVDAGRGETIFYTVKVDIQGNILSDTAVVGEGARKDRRFNEVLIQQKLRVLVDYLMGRIGEGVLGPIEEFIIVDNLGGIDSDIPSWQKGSASYLKGRQMLIDIDVLMDKSDMAIKDVGTHEDSEARVRLVETNPGIQEVTATYSALEALLETAETIPQDLDAYITFLRQENNGLDSNEYASLVEHIRDEKERLDADGLIALSIGYVLNTARYSHLADSLKDVTAEDIQEARRRMETAQNIYREIALAKAGSMDKLKETLRPVIEKTKFAQAKMKVNMLASVWSINTSFIDALSRNRKFIKLDAAELILPQNQHIVEWLKKLTKEQQSAFIFSSSDAGISAGQFLRDNNLAGIDAGESQKRGIEEKNIITLLELARADVNNNLPASEGFYLPYVYSITGIYLAAQIVIADGDFSKIQDNLVKSALRKSFEILCGKELSDDELKALFKGRWPALFKITENINNLRSAIAEIEKAA